MPALDALAGTANRVVQRYRSLEQVAKSISSTIAEARRWSPWRLLTPLRRALRGEMGSGQVREVLDALESASIPYWVAGGWGVDALIGARSRPHDDLDIILNRFDQTAPQAVSTLEKLGYRVVDRAHRDNWMPDQWQLKNAGSGRVDLVSLDCERLKAGLRQGSGGSGGPSAAAFCDGSIDGRKVPCLSAQSQRLLRSGYQPRRVDLMDLARLPSGT
jgi:lincosamide nucleotidyltransferase A/C/D/E